MTQTYGSPLLSNSAIRGTTQNRLEGCDVQFRWTPMMQNSTPREMKKFIVLPWELIVLQHGTDSYIMITWYVGQARLFFFFNLLNLATPL